MYSDVMRCSSSLTAAGPSQNFTGFPARANVKHLARPRLIKRRSESHLFNYSPTVIEITEQRILYTIVTVGFQSGSYLHFMEHFIKVDCRFIWLFFDSIKQESDKPNNPAIHGAHYGSATNSWHWE